MLYDLNNELSRQRFSARVRKLWEGRAIVDLTVPNRRTGSQNRYLHVILGILAMETGNPLSFIKTEIFKRRVNPDLFVTVKSDPVLGEITTLRSTRDLTSEEMSQAIDKYVIFCAQLGFYIPSPDEREMLEQAEYEIDRVSKWIE